MFLSDLLKSAGPQQFSHTISEQGLAVTITNVTQNSRQVTTGSLFVAVKGVSTDGHNYLNQAVKAGAVAILIDAHYALPPENWAQDLLVLKSHDTAKALGCLAAAYQGHPSKKLALVGITGTNGKTSCVTLLYNLFTQLGYPCGLISTVENKIIEKIIPSTHTTPDAVGLQSLLAQMVEAGCAYVFMEVSSHAVHQQRIAGTHFVGGAFTNITHDHLDYHGTFKEYINAKKAFFDQYLPASTFALTNLDDRNGQVMLQNTAAKKLGYSLRLLADFKGKILDNTMQGLMLEFNGKQLFVRLVGDFNAYNLLCVYGIALSLGQNEDDILKIISDLRPPEGRFQYVKTPESAVFGIVDYAHTPDALIKVLETLQELKGPGKIITVVGCGGDRDRSKRPIMARAASEHSGLVILTSDNPRTESPEAILDEMQEGLTPEQRYKAMRISDRREAIKTACNLAQPNDIILLAGKGHEKYQEINGIKHPFDDSTELENALKNTPK